MNATLGEALLALPVPGSDAAKERTKVLASEALAARGSEPAATRRPRRLAVGFVAAAGVAAFAIAPPGQSVAAWVGERLGLADATTIEVPPGIDCADYTLEENGEVVVKEVECEDRPLREAVRAR